MNKMDSKECASHIFDIYKSGVIMMSMAIGQEMGLFKLLCDADCPLTSQEIADKANKKERYVREWLNGMAAAKILQLDPETVRYYLTSGQKEALSAQSTFAPVLRMMNSRAPALMNCFDKDGPYGLQYEEATPFFDWFNEYRNSQTEGAIEREILPFFETQGLIARLESGISVIDIGCGSGNYTVGLARQFPNSSFLGVDFCQKAINIANKTKQEQKLANIDFSQGDAHNLSEAWSGSYDMVFVYDVLHDLPDPMKAISEIHKVLKQDGGLVLVEMGFHANPSDNVGNTEAAMYYSLSTFICLPCSMSAEPRVGYGACWGVENINKALEEGGFSIKDKAFPSIGKKSKLLYFCEKA